MPVTAAPLRIGIVGAGLMGRWHAHAARRAGARVSAVIDSERRRADALAARHRGCRAFSELGESLDLLDVVHVCTPTDSHVTLATQALAAGRHVLVEKPLAQTAQSTEALLGLAASRAVLVCPVHQFVFQDGVTTALRMLNAVGPLRHIDITICSAGAEGADPAVRDRIAREILPHPLSLLARLLPDSVPHLHWSVWHPAAGEIHAATEAQAVTVAMRVSMSARPTTNRMQIMGQHGTIHVDLFHGFALRQHGAVSRRTKLIQPFAYATMLAGLASANLVRRGYRGERAYPGLHRLVAEFYAAVTGGARCPITASETLAVARAYESLQLRVISSC